MQNLQKSPKSMSEHGFTQFELVNYLLQNLYKWDLTPTEQLVLLQLAYHYNPTNKFVYPKQRKIAHKINVSERSVIRAIQKLVKEGLILVECGLSNKYVFTSKLTAEMAQNKKNFKQDKMSEGDDKFSVTRDKMSQHDTKQTKEQIKEQTISVKDYKILKQYATDHKARNVNAYVNWLKSSGKANEILKEAKKLTERYNTGALKRLEQINNEQVEQVDAAYFQKIREQLSR